MSTTGKLTERAAQLRREFDAAFAKAVRLERDDFHDFLAIRVAGDPYGVPLGDVAGLYVDRTVVAIPSKNPALLGVAGFRGTVAPVYDLRALLGYPPSEDASSARLRWLLLIGGGEPISVAFEQFETQLRVAPDAISTADEGKAGMTRGTVRGDGIERPVLSLEYLKARVAAPR